MNHVLETSIIAPFPEDNQSIIFGMGCFGAQKGYFGNLRVYTTAVGYAGGNVKNPTYQSVCSGITNHTELF